MGIFKPEYAGLLNRSLQVDTVEINAQISANGQIGFMGSNVGMTGSTGIKFVLKRHR